MKENSKAPPAIGSKMMKMEQKDSWKPLKMFSGSMMILLSLGIKDVSKEKNVEKEKVKVEEDEDFSDQGKVKRKGRSNCTGEEEGDDWNYVENWNESFETDFQSWTDDTYRNDEDLYYMDERGYFQKKGFGKGKKGKKGKDDDGKGGKIGHGKGQSIYVQPAISQQPQLSSASSSAAPHAFLVGVGTDADSEEPVHVEPESIREDQLPIRRRTRRGGQNRRDERAARNPAYVASHASYFANVAVPDLREEYSCEHEKSSMQSDLRYLRSDVNSEEHSREQEISSTYRQARSFLANETSVSESVGTAFHSENRVSPTVCIMDLGCTRAMGSRRAATAFCKYVNASMLMHILILVCGMN